MALIFYQCECDRGDVWTILGDEGNRPGPATLCPNGHGVVAGRLDSPAFPVSLTIVQRAFESDAGVELRDRYLLSISDLDRTESRLSRSLYSWSEVVALAERFTGLSVSDALALWDRVNP